MPIYLGDTRVTIKNIIPALQYNVVGNVSITNGIASNFTDKTNYLLLSQPFNPGTRNWIFKTKFKFNSSSGTQTLIDRTSSRCFQISITSANKIKLHISKDGSGKTNEVTGTHALSTNTWYYLTFEYTGTQYICKYSTDGLNWTTEITINQTAAVFQGQILQIGRASWEGGSEHWTGEINLFDTYLGLNTELLNVDSWNLRTEWEGYKESDYIIDNGRLVWANPNIYLQSSGTQYINTNLDINLNDTIKMNVSIQDPGEGHGNFYIFESGSDGNNSRKGLSNYRFNTACSFYYNYVRSSYSTGYNILDNNTNKFNHKFYIETVLENSEYNYYFDGVLKKTVTASENIISRNLHIFSTTSNSFKGYCKLYNLQVYDYLTNYLKYHFVPVPTNLKIGSFTVPSNGMFDIVNQQFYPNQGTGTFVYGKD